MNDTRDDWAEGPGLVASIRRYATWVLACVVLSGAAGLIWSLQQPVRYAGTVHLYIGEDIRQVSDPGRVVRSRAQMVSSPAVLAEAAHTVGSTQSPQQLAKRITVTAGTDADVITVVALAATGPEAVALADAVVQGYLTVLDRQSAEATRLTLAALASQGQVLAGQIAQLEQLSAAQPGEVTVAAELSAKQEQLLATAKQREALAAQPPASGQALAVREGAISSTEPVQPRPVQASGLGAAAGFALAAVLAWGLAGRQSRRAVGPQLDQVAEATPTSSAAVRSVFSVIEGPPEPRHPPSPKDRRTVSLPERTPELTGNGRADPGEVREAVERLVRQRESVPHQVLRRVVAEHEADVVVVVYLVDGRLRVVAQWQRPGAEVGSSGPTASPLPEPVTAVDGPESADAARSLIGRETGLAGDPEREWLRAVGVVDGGCATVLLVPLRDDRAGAFGFWVIANRAAPDAEPQPWAARIEAVELAVKDLTDPLAAWWRLLRGTPSSGTPSSGSLPAEAATPSV